MPQLASLEKRFPDLAGFDTFHARRIAPELAALEERRRSLISRMGQSGFIAAAAVAGAVWLHFSGATAWAIAPLVVAVLSAIYAFKCYGDLRRGFKDVLVRAVCEFFGLEYAAEPGSGPLHWFRELSLLPDYDRSTLEDRVAGRHREVALDVVEAKLEERRTRSSKSGSKTYYVTVFRGLLGQFDFPKRFQGRTIVKTDRGGALNWFQGFATPGERVRLEDPRFEDAFEVWSSDQVEARYLLTPAFMERLLALDGHFGGGAITLGFDAERLLLAARLRRNLFEGGSIFAPADDPKRIEGIVAELALLFEVVDTLQLQLKTRI